MNLTSGERRMRQKVNGLNAAVHTKHENERSNQGHQQVFPESIRMKRKRERLKESSDSSESDVEGQALKNRESGFEERKADEGER
jgi:hypothetical protein